MSRFQAQRKEDEQIAQTKDTASREAESPLEEVSLSEQRKQPFLDRIKSLSASLGITRSKNKSIREKEASEDPLSKQEYQSLKQAFRHLRNFLSDHCPGLQRVRLALTVPEAVQGVAAAFITGQMLNAVETGSGTALSWGAAFVAVPVAIGAVSSVRQIIENRMGVTTFLGEKAEFVKRLFQQGFSELNDKKVKNEVEKLRANHGRLQRFGDAMFNMTSAIVGLGVAIPVMAAVSPVTTGIVCAGALPLLALEYKRSRLVERVESAAGKHHKTLWPAFFAFTNGERIQELKFWRQGAWAKDTVSKVTKKIERLQDVGLKGALSSTIGANIINGGISLGVGAYMLAKWNSGAVPIGDLVQFMGTMGALQMAVGKMVGVLGALKENTPFVNAYFEARNKDKNPFSPEEVKDWSEKLNKASVGIRMSAVRHSIDGKEILRVDELEFAPGSFTGIVGLKGAGKTTLVNLLLGLQAPSEGKVELLIDEEPHNLEEVPLPAWHSHVGYSFQDPYDGHSLTVKESIELGTHEDDCGEALSLEEAMRMSGVLKTITAEEAAKTKIINPKNSEEAANDGSGMDGFLGLEESGSARIGEEQTNGRRFSGGEIQSICNARTLIGNRKVLFFDEPTAALDAESEGAFLENLSELKGEKILAMISHRFTTFKDVGKIVVLKAIPVNPDDELSDKVGVIEAVGTHSELMAKGGTYASLYNRQLEALEREEEAKSSEEPE